MSRTHYSHTVEFRSHYTDSNGEDVTTSISFDALHATSEKMEDKFADFLRSIGYSWVTGVTVSGETIE